MVGSADEDSPGLVLSEHWVGWPLSVNAGLDIPIQFSPTLATQTTPVRITDDDGNPTTCNGLEFVNCTFGGAEPLTIHNCVVHMVRLEGCHFESTRFYNLVLKEIQFMNCKFVDSWFSDCEYASATVGKTFHRRRDDGIAGKPTNIAKNKRSYLKFLNDQKERLLADANGKEAKEDRLPEEASSGFH